MSGHKVNWIYSHERTLLIHEYIYLLQHVFKLKRWNEKGITTLNVNSTTLTDVQLKSLLRFHFSTIFNFASIFCLWRLKCASHIVSLLADCYYHLNGRDCGEKGTLVDSFKYVENTYVFGSPWKQTTL